MQTQSFIMNNPPPTTTSGAQQNLLPPSLSIAEIDANNHRREQAIKNKVNDHLVDAIKLSVEYSALPDCVKMQDLVTAIESAVINAFNASDRMGAWDVVKGGPDLEELFVAFEVYVDKCVGVVAALREDVEVLRELV
ncbi:hypothetical protein E4T38_01753 [Aureobasidium subglaciale]|nr:hypothetical protein E4T38_01753 [Aureobasidium subglaciale]KAI5229304.1 hypothetical protein E4T40_01727 [Aureobasidium subglaciale]KAI5233023.1 hypothetical protein E4T41_01751 [Aureobasidium subglaciale]KAI5266301.1 hypothetical protein E4T46_01724 [Aureobasidium subglaciale]